VHGSHKVGKLFPQAANKNFSPLTRKINNGNAAHTSNNVSRTNNTMVNEE
jgi:hypothetical protein